MILARKIDKLELSVTKKKKENQWYENAAKDLDVELDDMMYPLIVDWIYTVLWFM